MKKLTLWQKIKLEDRVFMSSRKGMLEIKKEA